MLGPGDPAPDLPVKDDRGETLHLAELWAKCPLILFFYPGDFTPICTREACHFRDHYGDLTEKGAEVAGNGGPREQRPARLRHAHQLPYRLLSDGDGRVAKAFGIQRALGLGDKRVTFVIDVGGTIREAIHSEIRAKVHVDRALAALEGLASPPAP
ncbi:MAG: peroxiredoxin [Myxococcales bacterium]|nr:peroxiredoxin [Myxococcales bacterium]